MGCYPTGNRKRWTPFTKLKEKKPMRAHIEEDNHKSALKHYMTETQCRFDNMYTTTLISQLFILPVKADGMP